MNFSTIWGVAKIAATRIPWGKVVQNIPAMADLATRAKERFMGGGGSLEERVRMLQEENRRLEKALIENSGHLQQTIKTLKVVAARQKVLVVVTAISFITAVVSLVIALK